MPFSLRPTTTTHVCAAAGNSSPSCILCILPAGFIHSVTGTVVRALCLDLLNKYSMYSNRPKTKKCTYMAYRQRQGHTSWPAHELLLRDFFVRHMGHGACKYGRRHTCTQSNEYKIPMLQYCVPIYVVHLSEVQHAHVSYVKLPSQTANRPARACAHTACIPSVTTRNKKPREDY